MRKRFVSKRSTLGSIFKEKTRIRASFSSAYGFGVNELPLMIFGTLIKLFHFASEDCSVQRARFLQISMNVQKRVPNVLKIQNVKILQEVMYALRVAGASNKSPQMSPSVRVSHTKTYILKVYLSLPFWVLGLQCTTQQQ